jgi:EmrB/QacA subfamily drug resistance transporter
VPAGRLADRYGRRRSFVVGLTVFTAGSALCAAAGSIEMLIAARGLQAVGAAIVMPTSLALLLPAFPPAKRAVAIGVWAAIGGVAAASGPPLGGLLVQVDWRWVFLINLPIGVLAIVAAYRVLGESRDETQTTLPDLAGTVVLAASIAALALGFVKAPEWGWGDARVAAAFAVSVAAMIAFLRRSASHPSPVVDLPMLRVRSFAAANGALVLFFAAFGAMLLGGVLFMTEVWGDSVLRAGLSLSPGPLMAAAFAVPAGKLGPRVGPGRLAAVGALLFAAGTGWWAWQLDPGADYAGELLPGLLLTGVGVGLVLATLSSAAVSSLPPARLATGSAVVTMSRQIGAVLGVSVLVAILGHPSPQDAAGAFTHGFLFMGLAAAAAAIASLAVGPVAGHGTAETHAAPIAARGAA